MGTILLRNGKLNFYAEILKNTPKKYSSLAQ